MVGNYKLQPKGSQNFSTIPVRPAVKLRPPRLRVIAGLAPVATGLEIAAPLSAVLPIAGTSKADDARVLLLAKPSQVAVKTPPT